MSDKEYILIRGKKMRLYPFSKGFAERQTKEHSVFSNDGHDWVITDNENIRKCSKCFATHLYTPNGGWFSLIQDTFTTEDIEEIIKKGKKAYTIVKE